MIGLAGLGVIDGGAPVAAAGADYLPFELGSRWVFQEFSPLAPRGIDALLAEVWSVHPDGEAVTSLAISLSRETHLTWRTTEEGALDLLAVSYPTLFLVFEPPIRILDAEPDPTGYWPHDIVATTVDGLEIELSFRTYWTDVVTPSGTYPAIGVELHDRESRDLPLALNFALSEGVGFVRLWSSPLLRYEPGGTPVAATSWGALKSLYGAD